MGALGLLALFIRANFSLICNTPRDAVFPDRVKIKITISKIWCHIGVKIRIGPHAIGPIDRNRKRA